MLIDPEKLTRAGLCRVLPESIAPSLDVACSRFEISTPARLAGFLSQCSHESNGFSVTRENLNYSAARLRQVFPRMFPTDASAA